MINQYERGVEFNSKSRGQERKKIWVILFFAFVITIGIYSCHCAAGCTNYGYQFLIEFTGYNDVEVTPVILKSYVKGSNFSKFVDSVVYNDLANGTILASDSSLHAISFIQGNDSTDYVVNLPNAGASYRITEMLFQATDCRNCGKTYSVPELSIYTVNGRTIYTPDGNIDLHK